MRIMPTRKKVRPDIVSRLSVHQLRRMVHTTPRPPEPWIHETHRVCVRVGKSDILHTFNTPRLAGEYVRQILQERGDPLVKPDWTGLGCHIGEKYRGNNLIQVYWCTKEEKEPIAEGTVRGEAAGPNLTDIERKVFEFGFGV